LSISLHEISVFILCDFVIVCISLLSSLKIKYFPREEIIITIKAIHIILVRNLVIELIKLVHIESLSFNIFYSPYLSNLLKEAAEKIPFFVAAVLGLVNSVVNLNGYEVIFLLKLNF